MKTLSITLIGALLISMAFVSCKKDKDDDNNPTPTVKNYFKVGDVEYLLAKGFIENYGQDGDIGDGWDYDGFNIDLSFLSSGFTITNSGDTLFDITGSGQFIYFEMFSSNGEFLDNGEYNFSAAQPFPVKSFDSGDYSINLNIDNLTGDFFELSSGKVTVTRSGTTYTITINCTDQDGHAVTGSYKGTLNYFDYTAKKKSAKRKF